MSRRTPAPYARRIIALLIDWLIHAGTSFLGILIGVSLLFSDQSRPVGIIVTVLTLVWSLGFGIYNNIVRQGRTGQTLGKQQQNIMLVNSESGAAPGVGSAFFRWLVFTGFSLITGGIYVIVDYLAPAVGHRGCRITDRLLSLEVVEGGRTLLEANGRNARDFDELSDPY